MTDIDIKNKIAILENEYARNDSFIKLLKNMHKQDELIYEKLMKLDQIKNEIELLRSQNTILR
jgi:hypothetical protein